MRKNKKSSRSRRNLAILYILIFIVVAFFVYWMIKHQRQKPPTKPNPSPETSETKNSSPPTNHPTLTTSESEDSNPQTPVQNEDAHPNDSTTLTGAITYLSKNQDKLTVRVNIDQYLSGGTCVLKLATAGHTPLAYQAPIVSSASTATCQGFDIPLSDLTPATWQVSIELFSGDRTGLITGEVTI